MQRKLFLIVALGVLVFDLFTKVYITKNLFPGQSIPIIKNLFHISLVHNTGIAFGLFKSQAIFFIILSLIVVLCILADFILRYGSYTLNRTTAFGLIFGGALGNLIDRLRFGYVIDFLDFLVWPVFNIADSAITTGVILLVVEFLFGYKNKDRCKNASSSF